MNSFISRRLAPRRSVPAARPDAPRLLPAQCPAFPRSAHACSFSWSNCACLRGENHRACFHQEQQRQATPGRTLLLPACCWCVWCSSWPAASSEEREREREQSSMDVTSCSTPMDTILYSVSAVAPAWLSPAHTGAVAPEGTTSACVP
jgi:hypothetical protein